MNITDDQLSNWTNPWFNNEEERAEKTKEIVKSTIDTYLSDLKIRVFAKGSYPNNTNVRQDSDIDIAVELEDKINLEYSNGVGFSTTGLYPYSGISELNFKLRLQKALETKFGKKVIDSTGNKVFRIRGSDKILNADVIPCTTYRFYYDRTPFGYRQGIQLILNKPDGRRYFNYPDQHYANGISKNTSTKLRFKNVTRILKNINGYISENYGLQPSPSFMIESMLYNVDNSVYILNETWRGIALRSCENIWSYLNNDESKLMDLLKWKEVNGYKFLFHNYQKWTKDDAKQFIKNAYTLLSE
ncbi:MAG: nucleotidyltransferase [Clostridia bacterium]|nr:nucleotidyltransferase [Clostridia bacterium]